LQSADKDQQEMRAVAEKPRDAVVKFDTYRNVQRHRAVLPAIARHLALISACKSDVSVVQAFKVIQDHWFWHQSKARIRLPISPS